MAGKIWTDHNLHDPGITILELLCYAITDLSYRASLPIEDLLAPAAAEATTKFTTAGQILPAAPATVNDYRKLLIDLDGVMNAWFEKAELSYAARCAEGRLEHLPKGGTAPAGARQVDIRGIYDIVLALEQDIESNTEQKENLIKAVLERLNRNRGLCIDFGEVRLVQRRELMLCAEIDLLPEADVEAVEAEIFYRIQRHLTPAVRFRSLQEMKDRGAPVDEIFDGPSLDHGFIESEDLDGSELRDSIRLSDVIGIVMKTEGVRSVRDLVLDIPSEAEKGNRNWTIDGLARLLPVLRMNDARMVYYKGAVPLKADKARTAEQARKMLADERRSNKKQRYSDMPAPAGRPRAVQKYYPVQNDFPSVYGIGRAGLPQAAAPRRKAQARQLKAYLLFAEQIMADYCAQLSNAWKLFSLDEKLGQTYFSQVIGGDSIKDIGELYGDYGNLEHDLAQMTESPERFLERRNRFLDHLLARFAEAFNEYALAQYDLSRFNTVQDKQERIIRDKLRFLTEYPEISRRRGLAYDAADRTGIWNTTNVSGLEHRVARLIGMDSYARRDLLALEEETYLEKDEDHADEYRFRIRDDRGKILLSSSKNYLSKGDALRELRTTLAASMTESGYQRKETGDGRFYFNIIDQRGEIVSRRIEYFATAQAREEAIEYLLSFLTARHCSEEGLFVVEHILLRPDPAWTGTQDPRLFLPLCNDSAGGGCGDPDPYSFKISVVLPAWPDRFQDMHFRSFVERVVRMETPSHILPRICFVDVNQMDGFERAYRKWLDARAGGGEGERKSALKELIDVLIHLKNVYPQAKLSDCGKPDDLGTRLILDRTILGTTPEE
jgi:hypothetical protein